MTSERTVEIDGEQFIVVEDHTKTPSGPCQCEQRLAPDVTGHATWCPASTGWMRLKEVSAE